MREIGDGVYSFTIGEGNHSMFVVGDDAVAVFETFHSGHAEKLQEAVKSVTEKPVRYAFISHNHWDHASGGQVLSNAGAKAVMHQLAADCLLCRRALCLRPLISDSDGQRLCHRPGYGTNDFR